MVKVLKDHYSHFNEFPEFARMPDAMNTSLCMRVVLAGAEDEGAVYLPSEGWHALTEHIVSIEVELRERSER